jgi:enoyl-CoA hydratase/carnithine racemase
MGFARRAVPEAEVLPVAMDLARRIAAAAPLSVQQVKRTLRLATRRSFDAVLEIESLAQALLAQTKDAAEGIQAMLGRREPEFQGG